jgi:hypothetical protein
MCRHVDHSATAHTLISIYVPIEVAPAQESPLSRLPRTPTSLNHGMQWSREELFMLLCYSTEKTNVCASLPVPVKDGSILENTHDCACIYESMKPESQAVFGPSRPTLMLLKQPRPLRTFGITAEPSHLRTLAESESGHVAPLLTRSLDPTSLRRFCRPHCRSRFYYFNAFFEADGGH